MKTSKTESKKSKTINRQFVLVRTFSAGVHCGWLAEQHDHTLVLLNARRIWRWKDANTLNEIALRGVDETYSRISEAVPSITLADWIEVIPCSPAAKANLIRSRWGA